MIRPGNNPDLTKSGKNQNTWRKAKLHLLGNIGSRPHKQPEVKDIKTTKGHLERTKKLLETKISNRSRIEGTNT